MESNSQDIRWKQRFDSFKLALNRINEVVDSEKPENLSELEKEGLIQRFEYTFELAWKTLQDLLKHRGYEVTPGPNPVFQKSFENALISNHDGWRKMVKARNTTSHTYNEGEALEIVKDIYNEYAPLLNALSEKLNSEA